MTLPTIADIIALPEMAAGDLSVITWPSELTREVRWVHVIGTPIPYAPKPWFSGRELVITNVFLLPPDPLDQAEYVKAFARFGVSGLVVELSGGITTLSQELIDAAQESKLPLIQLGKEIRFLRVTEDAHAMILHSQHVELSQQQKVHSDFLRLALDGASIETAVDLAADTSGQSIIYEDLGHRILAFAGRGQSRELATKWQEKSRSTYTPIRTVGVGDMEKWLVTPVVARGKTWGRLAMHLGSADPKPLYVMVLEKAAMAISINQLIDEKGASQERQAHRAFLHSVITGLESEIILADRARELGIRLGSKGIVAFVVEQTGGAVLSSVSGQPIADRISNILKNISISALVADRPAGCVTVLLEFVSDSQIDRIIAAITSGLDRTYPVRTAVGSVVFSLRQIQNSIALADYLLQFTTADAPTKKYYDLKYSKLSELVRLLGNDPRVTAYWHRKLDRLIMYDQKHKTSLLKVLRVFLLNGNNKLKAASGLKLSRPSFYKKIAIIEAVLEESLTDAETLASLYFAVLASEVL